jgi:MFS transporter, SP family, general alpha glucoside:H+ symporter
MTCLLICVLDAFPQFNKKYGVQLPNGTYQVPAQWQAGLSNVSPHGFVVVIN